MRRVPALDRDEEAIARFLESGAIGAMRRTTRTRSSASPQSSSGRLVDTLAAGGVFASEDGQELVRLAADLLENALSGLSKTDAEDLERRFLDAAEGDAAGRRPAKLRRKSRATKWASAEMRRTAPLP